MGENILEYKGYYTKILYSVKDHVLYGKIEGNKVTNPFVAYWEYS